MDRERLDQWCEWGILGFVFSILIFSPLATGAVRPLEMLIVQGLTACVLLLWIIRTWLRKSHRMLLAPICWPVLGFTVYAMVRYYQADLEYVARWEVLKVLVYAILFFAIIDNLNRQEYAQWICFALIFLGMVQSIYAIYQFATGTQYVWHFLRPAQYGRRGSGTFICPNNLAGYLEIILPLALAFTFTSRFKATPRVFLGYASLAMLAGLTVTMSRGGWVAAGLALLVFFAFLLKQRNTRLAALAALVLLGGTGFFAFEKGLEYYKHRWKQMYWETGKVDDIRFYLWKPAVEIWKEHPWVGAGPAHFDYRFPAFRPEIVQMRPGRVHNDYLNTLTDWGLVGTGLVASAWGLLFWGLLKTWKYVRRSNDIATKPTSRGALVLGAGIGLVAILLHSIVDFNMHIPANAIVVVTLMAILTGYLRYATEGYWIKQGWILRIAFTLVALAAFAYLGRETVHGAQEYVYLERAQQHERVAKRQQDELQKQMDATDKMDWQLISKLSSEIDQASRMRLESLKAAYQADTNNFETTYSIGETLRLLSWKRGNDYQQLAMEALPWFEKGMKLNPYDGYNYLRYGMCLHLLDRHSEAEPYFKKALESDPSSFFMIAHYGWHFFVIENYPEAKKWFESSMKISKSVWQMNPIAYGHLVLLETKMAEKPAD